MSKSVRISYTDKDGKECAILVKKPTHSQLTDANLYSAGIFNRARKTGVCLRSQIDDWLEEQKIWTKEDRLKAIELEDEVNKKVEMLSSGLNTEGNQMKLSEARKLAIDIRLSRWKLNISQMQRRTYDEYTVEGQAENARFDCLCSLCLLDEEGNKLFKSVDDYYDASDEEYIAKAASKLANLMYGNEDWQRELPENQFLIKHKLSDNDGKLINKDGKFVDATGKVLTDEEAQVDKIAEPIFEDDII